MTDSIDNWGKYIAKEWKAKIDTYPNKKAEVITFREESKLASFKKKLFTVANLQYQLSW